MGAHFSYYAQKTRFVAADTFDAFKESVAFNHGVKLCRSPPEWDDRLVAATKAALGDDFVADVRRVRITPHPREPEYHGAACQCMHNSMVAGDKVLGGYRLHGVTENGRLTLLMLVAHFWNCRADRNEWFDTTPFEDSDKRDAVLIRDVTGTVIAPLVQFHEHYISRVEGRRVVLRPESLLADMAGHGVTYDERGNLSYEVSAQTPLEATEVEPMMRGTVFGFAPNIFVGVGPASRASALVTQAPATRAYLDYVGRLVSADLRNIHVLGNRCWNCFSVSKCCRCARCGIASYCTAACRDVDAEAGHASECAPPPKDAPAALGVKNGRDVLRPSYAAAPGGGPFKRRRLV